jgi:transposase-like protein/IS1 family transposase
MKKQQQEPMNTSEQFCPNETCLARGKIGEGNISIHGRKRPRYQCHRCGKTFSARKGTLFEGLRRDEEQVEMVVTLLSYGCPLQAIVHAFGLDERTVAAWQKRAGKHCQRVHTAVVEQGKVKSQHIQADEIRAKGRKLILWIALAMDVTTRLWLAGVVSEHRDRALIDRLFQHARVCCQFVHALLVCTDGFAAYPKSIGRAFREKVKKQAGRGRCSLEVWPDLCIATIIKHTKKKRVVEITRHVARGTCEKAQELLLMTKGCQQFNTSFIERLNGTVRERLASLTRKCRHAAARLETLAEGMYLIGCTYNFCFPHGELSKKTHFGCPTTPAMAAALTDHIWSMRELLMYKIAPSSWEEQKQAKRARKSPVSAPTAPKRPRGRPRTRPIPDPSLPKRPRGRPRIITLATSTV